MLYIAFRHKTNIGSDLSDIAFFVSCLLLYFPVLNRTTQFRVNLHFFVFYYMCIQVAYPVGENKQYSLDAITVILALFILYFLDNSYSYEFSKLMNQYLNSTAFSTRDNKTVP